MHGWGQVMSWRGRMVTSTTILSLADSLWFNAMIPVGQVCQRAPWMRSFSCRSGCFSYFSLPHPLPLCPDTRGGLHPQVKTEISVESKHQTLQGLAFPLQLDAQQAIQALKQKKINYIQLVGPSHGFSVPYSPHPAAVSHFHLLPVPSVHQKLDLERETIDLVHTSPTEITDLPKRIPQDSARYHFFLYKHSHEGDYLESVGESLSTGRGQLEPVPIPVYPRPLVACGARRDGDRDGATGSLESVPSCGGCWQSLWCHVQRRSLGAATEDLVVGGLVSSGVAGVPGNSWEE